MLLIFTHPEDAYQNANRRFAKVCCGYRCQRDTRLCVEVLSLRPDRLTRLIHTNAKRYE